MHRAWAWRLPGLALCCALVPLASAVAQSTAELTRRVDAAVLLRNEATAELEAYRRSHAVSRTFPDTVAMLDGAVRVLTSHELLPLVRAGAERADAFIRQRAGTRASLLAGTVFAAWTDSAQRAANGIIVSPRVDGHEIGERNSIAEARWVARVFEEYAQASLGTKDKPRFEAWLSGGLPVDTATNADWRSVRLELVSSRAAVAHRCYAGDLSACKATLGLTEEADPAVAWYDSATRRALVVAASKAGRLDQSLAPRCIAGRDVDCITLMRTSAALSEWSSPQASKRARTTLVQLVIAMGGRGALGRLAATGDSVPGAISALANVPVDSVVAQWQRHAHDGGIASEAATPLIALVACGWMLVIGGLSLRSQRWR